MTKFVIVIRRKSLPHSALLSLMFVTLVLLLAPAASAQGFVRGDATNDGTVALNDAIATLRYLFQGGNADCLSSLDVNDDGSLGLPDPLYLLAYLFAGGPTIPLPFPDPGSDPTADQLPCGAITISVNEAVFEDEDNHLDDTILVSGITSSNLLVSIRDHQSGVLFGVAMPAANGSWQLSLNNPLFVPCVIRAQIGDVFATRTLSGAPANCGPPSNLAPTCTITPPNSPIAVGEPVTFNAVAHDPEGGTLDVFWHFGGAVDATYLSTAESDIPFSATPIFDAGGQAFRVSVTVVDPEGARGTCRVSVLVGSAPDGGGRPPVAEQPAPSPPGTNSHVVIAVNDLGMHCADLGSQPFSILPPFNVLNAQVIERGTLPVVLDDTSVSVVYSAAANAADLVVFDPSTEPPSINSTSVNYPIGAPAGTAEISKTDFWDVFGTTTVAEGLFGLPLLPDEGLPTIHNPNGMGRRMPGFGNPFVANAPQPFSAFQIELNSFTAEGIPITAVDDYGRMNAYPLLRVQAHDLMGTLLATTDAVVPVSQEVDCRDCHRLGEVGSDPTAWSSLAFELPPADGDRRADEAAAKINILRLHDFKHGTTLEASQPVLCAGCHNSFALEDVTGGALAGDPTLDSMSTVMHGFHGRLVVDGTTGELARDTAGYPLLEMTPSPGRQHLLPTNVSDPNVTMEQNCFTCHPGKITQCFRGAMFEAGLKCSSCHGDMLATGGLIVGDFDHNGVLRARLPWRDEPRCESCHQGDAVNPGAALMLKDIGYAVGDPAAVPSLAPNPRFAEEVGKLYRHSQGHGGVACESCHGSPHAIWPNPDPQANDNVTALQLQGHSGTIRECSVCHTAGSFPNGTLDGPHGMHPVNDPNWVKSNSGDWHKHFAQDNSQGDSCAPCHGADHLGTRLSVTPVDRELFDADGNLRAVLRAGQTVSCDICHTLEESFDD